ncbi:MAG TPA: L-threonine 3-dehydrogenase [Desulfuromonadales bacterium]|nr:L-threonine 3-dehydrogenase [Desulfuromonadales bacterium]
MANQMKALVKTHPDLAEIQSIPIPECGPNDILVRVRSAALCGTDLHILEWNSWAQAAGIKLPIVMGHECCGDVVAIGCNIRGYSPGDKVVAETHIPCGTCYQCLNGEQHICMNLKIFGVHTNGCFAEYALIPAVCARKIPAHISHDVGSIMEPIGTAFRAALETRVGGTNVAVVGCGPIGLFAVASAAALGAALIIATDISTDRLSIARNVGADKVLNPANDDLVRQIMDYTDSCGVDVVIEASGNVAAVKQSFDFLRKGGTLAAIGLPGQSLQIELGRDVVFKEATIIGIHGRKMFETWTKMERLLCAGKLNINPVITHTMPLDKWQEGVQLARSGQASKIIFQL